MDRYKIKTVSLGAQESLPPILNLAVVGTGIAGLGAAWLLSKHHLVTLFDRNNYAGGHSNTVTVGRGVRETPVDTGFIVYNERNYPNLTALFQHLDIRTQASSMSFSVSLDDGQLEYCGEGLGGIFAQRRNIASVSMWRMLADILRFYRSARLNGGTSCDEITIGEFLRIHRYSAVFVNHHLLPMIAAIWSVPSQSAANFPLATITEFFNNHGLLQFRNRPCWRTVSGGSREYVKRLLARTASPIQLSRGIDKIVRTAGGVVLRDQFGDFHNHDGVIIATHADEALGLIAMPTSEEKRILGNIRYQPNRAVLHSDTRLMPNHRKVWSSWNVSGVLDSKQPFAITYWMNRLQGLSTANPLFVSINPQKEPRAHLIHEVFRYDHPIFDVKAYRAQRQLDQIQGSGNVWYCGSYFGYGFHEDALCSGLEIAERFGIQRPWRTNEGSRGSKPDRGRQLLRKVIGGQGG